MIWPETHKEENLESRQNESTPSKNQDPNARKMSLIIPENTSLYLLIYLREAY